MLIYMIICGIVYILIGYVIIKDNGVGAGILPIIIGLFLFFILIKHMLVKPHATSASPVHCGWVLVDSTMHCSDTSGDFRVFSTIKNDTIIMKKDKCTKCGKRWDMHSANQYSMEELERREKESDAVLSQYAYTGY